MVSRARWRADSSEGACWQLRRYESAHEKELVRPAATPYACVCPGWGVSILVGHATGARQHAAVLCDEASRVRMRHPEISRPHLTHVPPPPAAGTTPERPPRPATSMRRRLPHTTVCCGRRRPRPSAQPARRQRRTSRGAHRTHAAACYLPQTHSGLRPPAARQLVHCAGQETTGPAERPRSMSCTAVFPSLYIKSGFRFSRCCPRLLHCAAEGTTGRPVRPRSMCCTSLIVSGAARGGTHIIVSHLGLT